MYSGTVTARVGISNVRIIFASPVSILIGDITAQYPLGSVSGDGRTITITGYYESQDYPSDLVDLMFVFPESAGVADESYELICNDPNLFGSTSLSASFVRLAGTFISLDGQTTLHDASYHRAKIPLNLNHYGSSKNGTYYVTLKYNQVSEKFKIIINLN